MRVMSQSGRPMPVLDHGDAIADILA
jgi:hypothetical protein